MRQLALVITASLDGFIADERGGVDWLAVPPDDAPEGYNALMRAIDCLVMGSSTYLVSLDLDGGTDIFEGKDVFVFTSRTDLPRYPGVHFISDDAVTFTKALKERVGGTIWLFGGGRLATSLSDAQLVDEYLIAVQPVLLGEGIPLWVVPHGHTGLELVDARPWPGGIAELRYRRAIPAE
jgi:dihydrofolate reductase